GPSRNDERHRAGFDDLREVVAEVGLDEMCAEFGGDPTRKAQVSGIALLELFADRGHREDRDTDLLALIDEFPEVHQGIVPVVRREHDRVAVIGADDPRKTILKSPRHLVTSWSKSLELVSRINPFAARLGWQRHGPGTVLRLPRDHDRKVAKAAEEFREDLK